MAAVRTVTVPRGDIDLTVEFRKLEQDWMLSASLDENGKAVMITLPELLQARRQLEAGVDETGR